MHWPAGSSRATCLEKENRSPFFSRSMFIASLRLHEDEDYSISPENGDIPNLRVKRRQSCGTDRRYLPPFDNTIMRTVSLVCPSGRRMFGSKST